MTSTLSLKFSLFAPFSEGFCDLPSNLVPIWAMIKPCLLPCDKLGIYLNPTNQCRRVSSAPILLPQLIFLATFRCYVSPLFVRLLAQHGKSKLQPNPLLQFFILVRCCPLLEFGPCVSAGTVKACALIGDSSLELGDMWRCGCPKSLVWRAEREGTSSSEDHEHNVEKPRS